MQSRDTAIIRVTEVEGRVHLLVADKDDEDKRYLLRLSGSSARELGEQLYKFGCDADGHNS